MPERDYWHKTIQRKGKFDSRSFRVITLRGTKGVKMTVGCPKGAWSARKKRCKVGMQCQKLMFPKKNYTKAQAEKWVKAHPEVKNRGKSKRSKKPKKPKGKGWKWNAKAKHWVRRKTKGKGFEFA